MSDNVIYFRVPGDEPEWDGVLICDNCGLSTDIEGLSEHHGPHPLPDSGWEIRLQSLGYYGGFTDIIDEDDDKHRSVLCHDCVVSLVSSFPAFAKILFGKDGNIGGHPSLNWKGGDDGTTNPPCCAWAWSWKKIGPNNYIQYRATTDGRWEEYN